MNVLENNVPKLDYNDPAGSLQKIYNYLYKVMEQIDYTLSRQGLQLGKVNLPATEKQIQQIEGRVNSLNSRMAVLTGTVSTVNSKADRLEDRLNTAEGTLRTLGTTMNSLEKRVKALEDAQQPTEPPTP